MIVKLLVKHLNLTEEDGLDAEYFEGFNVVDVELDYDSVVEKVVIDGVDIQGFLSAGLKYTMDEETDKGVSQMLVTLDIIPDELFGCRYQCDLYELMQLVGEYESL